MQALAGLFFLRCFWKTKKRELALPRYFDWIKAHS